MEIINELVESIQIKQNTEIEVDRIPMQSGAEKVLIGYETQIGEYDIEIQMDFKKAPLVVFPIKYMENIFGNLFSNSVKYKSTDRRPFIKMKTEIHGDSILLSVADNGLGIDLIRHKGNIFKIRKTFHRHAEAKGFGLFMTRTQVEAMGGKIWAESQPDMGSTFFVEFKNQNV